VRSRLVEPALGLVCGEPPELDDLVPRGPARDDRNGGPREVEALGEQADDGIVCAAAFRRRADTHLPRVTVPAGDLRARRPGRDPEAEPCRPLRHLV